MTKREIPFGRPWITDQDRQAVMRVLEGHILTHGPECKSFEAEFATFLGGQAHCVTVSSCMAALHLAYVHLGVGAGDEVIVPALTHVATAHAVEFVGARPVFVDCDAVSGNVTAAKIADAITPKTRAISVVHFAGIPCDMPSIVKVAEQNNLKVVEDCALAVGARWAQSHVGLFGDVGCFSFYPVKHITTGEGGMFVSRQRAVAESVAKLRAFGVDRSHTERSIPGMYEVPSVGINYRMSELQAALGRTQIARIAENLKRRSANFGALKQRLANIPNVHVLDVADPNAANSHYCLVAILEGKLASSRNDIVARLNGAGVGTSVYYPQPVPRMVHYRKKYGYDAARFPNATVISDSSIALPVGWHVTPEDIDYIGNTFKQVVEGSIT
jgi:dTDP-4-amino-4,6-dideoxygalactose transaminase